MARGCRYQIGDSRSQMHRTTCTQFNEAYIAWSMTRELMMGGGPGGNRRKKSQKQTLSNNPVSFWLYSFPSSAVSVIISNYYKPWTCQERYSNLAREYKCSMWPRLSAKIQLHRLLTSYHTSVSLSETKTFTYTQFTLHPTWVSRSVH